MLCCAGLLLNQSGERRGLGAQKLLVVLWVEATAVDDRTRDRLLESSKTSPEPRMDTRVERGEGNGKVRRDGTK